MSTIYPAHKYFRIIRSAGFDYTFEYLASPLANPHPIDLTTYTGIWEIDWKTSTSNGTITYHTGATPGTSGIFFTGPTGFVNLKIIPADTMALPAWISATHQLTLTGSGQPYALLYGGVGIIS